MHHYKRYIVGLGAALLAACGPEYKTTINDDPAAQCDNRPKPSDGGQCARCVGECEAARGTLTDAEFSACLEQCNQACRWYENGCVPECNLVKCGRDDGCGQPCVHSPWHDSLWHGCVGG